MGIFSLVQRVIPPVTSQLTTAFLVHFIWFTNWSSQAFCKKWVEEIRHELLLDYHLKQLGEVITTELIQALTGEMNFSDIERKHQKWSLPPKVGGIGIPNIVNISGREDKKFWQMI